MALAVALVAAACSAGAGSDAAPTTRPPTTTSRATTTRPRATTSSTTPPSTPSTTAPAASTLHWSECDGGFECSKLRVPVDHRKPRGPKLTLAIARRPATDPAHRIGSLMMNPGGPGQSAIDFIESSALPAALTRRFDIVGFDPRGVGQSTPLECRHHLQEIYRVDPTIDTPSDRTALLRASKAFVDECAAAGKGLLPFLGTADVARDMDLVRAALGEEQVSYVGYSYGTSIGEQYARLFPTRVRAMVLDGVVDPSLTGLAAAAQQAEGFSRALDAFISECDRNNCGLGTSAGDVVDEVIADAETKPIRASGADRPAGPGEVNLAIAEALYTDELWPQLARALAQARNGNGTGLVRLADSYLQRRADRSYAQGFEVYFAASCLDSTWPDDPQAVLDAAKVVAKQYPRVGEGLVNDYVRCALWPVPPKPLTGLTRAVKGLAPVVIVSTTGDPATPHAGAVRVARSIPHSVLVTNRGDGHTIYTLGKDCIDRPVTKYLTDLTLPRAGIVCE